MGKFNIYKYCYIIYNKMTVFKFYKNKIFHESMFSNGCHQCLHILITSKCTVSNVSIYESVHVIGLRLFYQGRYLSSRQIQGEKTTPGQEKAMQIWMIHTWVRSKCMFTLNLHFFFECFPHRSDFPLQ